MFLESLILGDTNITMAGMRLHCVCVVYLQVSYRFLLLWIASFLLRSPSLSFSLSFCPAIGKTEKNVRT